MQKTTPMPILGKREAKARLLRQQEAATSHLKWRTRRLNDAQDVRRLVSHLINETASGRMQPEVASRLGGLCQVILSCLKMNELEVVAARVAELERRLLEAGQ